MNFGTPGHDLPISRVRINRVSSVPYALHRTLTATSSCLSVRPFAFSFGYSINEFPRNSTLRESISPGYASVIIRIQRTNNVLGYEYVLQINFLLPFAGLGNHFRLIPMDTDPISRHFQNTGYWS